MEAVPGSGAVALSVIIEGDAGLAELAFQTISDAELVTISESVSGEAAATASKWGWDVRSVTTIEEAVASARGTLVVEWTHVSFAEPNALAEMVDAATRSPGALGATASNFDPLSVYRVARYRAGHSFGWFVDAPVKALDMGGGQLFTVLKRYGDSPPNP